MVIQGVRMDFRDELELKELKRQGVQPDMALYADEMEKLLVRLAEFRKEIEIKFLLRIQKDIREGEQWLTLLYEDPTDEEREVVSICEAWLTDKYTFQTTSEVENRKETLTILILLA